MTGTPFESVSDGIARIVALCGLDPLRGMLGSMLPQFDTQAWSAASIAQHKAMSGGFGHPRLIWPIPLPERVACRLDICASLAKDVRGPVWFITTYFGHDGDHDVRAQRFVEIVVRPM